MKKRISFPQRILMTTDSIGGVWSYALELCQLFQQFHIEVVLAVMGEELSLAQHHALEKLSNTTWVYHQGCLEWMDDPWEDVEKCGKWLMEVVDQHQPDLIHFNHYSHASLPWKVPKIVVAHSCVVSWWAAVKSTLLPDDYACYRQKLMLSLAAADAVVAPTTAMFHSLVFHYGALPKGYVIPKGCDLSSFGAATPIKENFIFSAGHLWDEAKNIELLNDIAPELKWPVQVAGSLGLQNKKKWKNVKNLGFLKKESLINTLKKTSIYASPALYEPFGLSVLEAALNGCALVLADIQSFREIWKNAAIFVSPKNKRDWIVALNEVSADASKRQQLAFKARQRGKKFSAAMMGKRYVQLYQNILTQKSHGDSSRDVTQSDVGKEGDALRKRIHVSCRSRSNASLTQYSSGSRKLQQDYHEIFGLTTSVQKKEVECL